MSRHLKTKQEAVDAICDLLKMSRVQVSRGSTEPASILVEACRQLDLWREGTKPELAERIVRRAGLSWGESCDSRTTPSGGGSTVTLTGLRQVHAALVSLEADGQLDD